MLKGSVLVHLFDFSYRISPTGRIQSLHDRNYGYQLRKKLDKDGYPTVTLCKDGIKQTFSMHRLMAIAYVPNPENKPEVNHLDGNKLNYLPENLAWATASENMQHAYKMGLCKLPNNNKKVID